jgi:hypothetical protein
MIFRIAILLLPVWLLCSATEQAYCNVGQFEYLAISIHNPTERKRYLLSWVSSNGSICTKDEISALYSNLAHLAGTSDDGEIRMVLQELYKKASQ